MLLSIKGSLDSVEIPSAINGLVRVSFALSNPNNPINTRKASIHQVGGVYRIGVSPNQQLRITCSSLSPDKSVAVCIFLHPKEGGRYNVCTFGDNVCRLPNMKPPHWLDLPAGDQFSIATTIGANWYREDDSFEPVIGEPLTIKLLGARGSTQNQCGVVVEHTIAPSFSIFYMWRDHTSRRLGKHNLNTHYTPLTTFYMDCEE